VLGQAKITDSAGRTHPEHHRSLKERLRRTNASSECYLCIALYTRQPRRALEYAK
jgi:hypothetical protein